MRAKRSWLGTLFLLATAAISGSSAADEIGYDFVGTYDPSHWTLVATGNGTVDLGGVPASIRLLGSDLGILAPLTTDYTVVAVGTGMVQFDWDFMTTGGDSFGYLLDGVFTPLTSVADTGTATFNVMQGQVFGFRINSDNLNAVEVTINNFCAPLPEPSTALLLGAGLLALGVGRRRQ